MKKILSLILCLILSVTMLASCDDGVIGDYEYPDYEPTYVPTITLDVHVIVGEGTEELAIDSVGRMLSQHSETKLKTKLNVHYISEADYVATLKADIGKSGAEQADIVLINSPELANELVSGGYLQELTEYYNGSTFGRLNTIITHNLIEASRIDGKLYTVPNDHMIGEYTYLLINEAVATSYNFSPAKLAACTGLEDETVLALKAAIEADGKVFEDYVSLKVGNYDDKALYASQGYVCNVVSYPNADANEAFKSAFAVVKGTQYPERAMEVIYLLNTDSYFRNLFQYGVEGINYVKGEDGIIVPHTVGDGVYNMNMLYTGSAFLLEYSADWTESMKKLAENQNDESVVLLTPPVTPAPTPDAQN